ncbi:KpsF/GutQ family sugar-phosphate isomerase [Bauldia sp.]|uniref:KpsF/GutQ family sugar-phosphate isomerase n=1 Tax=Bauldia sp. TaxID=2575872 RepID=UPI003BA8991F
MATMVGAGKSVDGPVDSARRTVEFEQAGLAALQAALDNGLAGPFTATVDLIRGRSGRVVVSGLGKSGHVGRKIAATLASTGTPSLFVHAAEASHGDLGMVTGDDVVLALSWSGETAELRSVVEYARRFDIPLVAMTADATSSLAREADIVLLLPRVAEACPHGLAPTTSTLLQLGLGDALAIALLESHGFTAEGFHAFHPGGKLGANLKFVRDIMHRGDALPLTAVGTAMSEGILLTSEKGFGCLGVVDDGRNLVGIITDGDLRRHLGPGLLDRRVEDVMTRSPKTVPPDMIVGAAIDILNQAKITALFVVEDRRPVGIVHMHDLLRTGVV